MSARCRCHNHCRPGRRRPPILSALAWAVVVFLTVWAALTWATTMHDSATCMLAALAAWWVLVRRLRSRRRTGWWSPFWMRRWGR
ncbi:hypothetical protein [Actinomadura rudentiformis]|uniref:Uncharacterized protein n=1 Tax=Actinomadura rudentiformis TaxID=359158 RepID=A0A6H9ZBB6_9ACTN|nr:hypothetical protein [Actinomadura rudentiformis]KAB2351612.1 hypothetical protein F8566_05145 [Actinomadura rudentiformis]